MPTYDYRCPFGHDFEAVQPVALRESAACPEHGCTGRYVFVPSNHRKAAQPFKEYLEHNWGPQPIRITSGRMRDRTAYSLGIGLDG